MNTFARDMTAREKECVKLAQRLRSAAGGDETSAERWQTVAETINLMIDMAVLEHDQASIKRLRRL